MPNTFRHKNGANLSGHADKWSDENRDKNSHNAGQGSKGSRNQGTGEQGRLNTIASKGTSTQGMDQEEKLKYFNSLGLLGSPKKLAIKDFPNELRRIFADEPVYFKDISTALKSVPAANYPNAVQTAFNALLDITERTSDEYDIYEYIMTAIQNSN